MPFPAYQAAVVPLMHTRYDIKIARASQNQSSCLGIIKSQGCYTGVIKDQFETLALFLEFLCSLLSFVPGIDNHAGHFADSIMRRHDGMDEINLRLLRFFVWELRSHSVGCTYGIPLVNLFSETNKLHAGC